MTPTVDPDNKKFLILLLFAGILMTGLIVFTVMTYSGSPVPGRSNSPAEGTPVNPVTIQPGFIITTVSPNNSGSPLVPTMIPITTPASMVKSVKNPISSPEASPQPIVTTLPLASASGDSSDTVVPRPFTLSVSPASASGKPGETISYTLRIDGGEGQTEPIHFRLTASALLFSQTYDLGDEQPPFPKTSVYLFAIPGNIPSGITINGVLTASGAGQTREQLVTLKVL